MREKRKRTCSLFEPVLDHFSHITSFNSPNSPGRKKWFSHTVPQFSPWFPFLPPNQDSQVQSSEVLCSGLHSQTKTPACGTWDARCFQLWPLVPTPMSSSSSLAELFFFFKKKKRDRIFDSILWTFWFNSSEVDLFTKDPQVILRMSQALKTPGFFHATLRSSAAQLPGESV